MLQCRMLAPRTAGQVCHVLADCQTCSHPRSFKSEQMEHSGNPVFSRAENEPVGRTPIDCAQARTNARKIRPKALFFHFRIIASDRGGETAPPPLVHGV